MISQEKLEVLVFVMYTVVLTHPEAKMFLVDVSPYYLRILVQKTEIGSEEYVKIIS
jgi:hypothetical protein